MLDSSAPTFSFFVSAIGAMLFWLILPISFLIGTAWNAIVAGYKIGRDW